MNARRYQRKRGVKRVFVTLLTFVMLLSVCFPGLSARAEGEEGTVPPESTVAPTETVPETTAPAETQPDITEGENVPGETQGETVPDETQAIMSPNAANGVEPLAETGITPMAETLPNFINPSTIEVDQLLQMKPGESQNLHTDHTNVTNFTYVVYDENGDPMTNSGISVQTRTNGGIRVQPSTSVLDGTYYVGVSYDYRITTGHWDWDKMEWVGTHEDKTALYYIKIEVLDYDSNELEQSNVKSTHVVFYDVTDGDRHGLGTGKIESVKLGGIDVQHGDSNLGAGSWTSQYTLGDSYGTIQSHITYATLQITPIPGYYVTDILIVCAQNSGGPYDCGINKRGSAFSMSFGVGQGGALEVRIPSVAFGHGNSSGTKDRDYFILIQVAAVPTPLFVEYDYGNIEELGISHPLFSDPEGWLTPSEDNKYVAGAMETANTQFKYAYETGRESDVVYWKHYANTVNSDVKAAANEAGYYFAGWEATYYNKCTSDYQFSEVYNPKPTVFEEGADVRLITHVRLVAKWEPIELKLTKIVAGLPSVISPAQTYELTVNRVTQEGKRVFVTVPVTADKNGTHSTILSATFGNRVKPGVYTVEETKQGEPVNIGGVIYYPTQSLTIGQVDVRADGTIQELSVTNTYTAATPAVKFVKQWQDSDGNVISGAEGMTATLKVTLNDGTEKEVVLDSSNGWTVVMNDLDPADIKDIVESSATTGYQFIDFVKSTEIVSGETNYMYTVYTAINKLTMAEVTLTKSVTGNMGDWSKDFTFTITGVDGTVTLKHNGTKTFSAPIGSTVTITESGNEDYKVTATVDGKPVDMVDGAITFTVSAGGNAIVFINNKEAQIDTGLAADSTPFAVLFAVAALGAVLLLKKRRTAF